MSSKFARIETVLGLAFALLAVCRPVPAAPTAGGVAASPIVHSDTSRLGRPFAKDPSVIRFGGRYLLYYSVPGAPATGGAWGIGVAASRDLDRWEKIGEVAPQQDVERKGICAPCAVVHEGRVHLFYQTYGNGREDAICHAVSDDGLVFARDPTNPVFRPDGSWNAGRAIDAEVVIDGSRALLYYATRDPKMERQMLGVAVADSRSGFSRGAWRNLSVDGPLLAPELPWEGKCIEAASVVRRDGRWFMFYAGGYNNAPQQVGLALSEDGVSWRRQSSEALLRNGGPGAWNASESGHPGAFVDEDGRTHLFFQGNADKGRTWHLARRDIVWTGGLPSLGGPPSGPPRPVAVRSAAASSVYSGNDAAKAVDGDTAATSRWTAGPSSDPFWLELELEGTHVLAGIQVFSGIGEGTTLSRFSVQYWVEGDWRDVPSGTVSGNRAAALTLPFDDTTVIRTGRIRLWIPPTPDRYARVREVVVWEAGRGAVPPPEEQRPVAPPAEPVAAIYLNQSGFNLGAPKRFTAPRVPDGTRFVVRPAAGGAAAFAGVIEGKVGDFSAFDPVSAGEFVIEAGPVVSVPFRIGPWWLERVTYQNAMNFMIDSRHYVGNWREPCRGSYGWRDDHHFGWELHTLVPQFLSNPSAYRRMPRQIVHEAPGPEGRWGALQPCREDAPDIVKLIHWGADIIVTQRLKHEHLKAQLAYFLYAWPWIREWLPEQNLQAASDYAFGCWTEATADRSYPYDESPEHDLLALKTRLGTTKGALPPGASIEPNLLMHAVAARAGRSDAARYLEAAVAQARWMVANLDWDDPQTTKGQRMSEFLTVTGLAHLLQEHPDKAPPGLAEKIEAWARVVIRRSANLWDFRKLDDGDRWTPMGEKPTMWNEPGNVVGLPGAILAAEPHVRDAASRVRLRQIAWAHFDAMFGRNPVGRHFSHDAPREIEGVERGWYNQHPGGIGMLENARFVIDGSPKNPHYPYNAAVGNVGWTEGWVQFNVAFNNSLAYLAHSETRIEVERRGSRVVVRLVAPLNFDYSVAEAGTVRVRAGEDEEDLEVREAGASAWEFTGSLSLARGPIRRGDGILQVADGAVLEAAYAYGFLERRARASTEGGARSPASGP